MILLVHSSRCFEYSFNPVPWSKKHFFNDHCTHICNHQNKLTLLTTSNLSYQGIIKHSSFNNYFDVWNYSWNLVNDLSLDKKNSSCNQKLSKCNLVHHGSLSTTIKFMFLKR